MFKIIEEENIVIKNFLFRCHLSMEITEALCGSDIMSFQNSLSPGQCEAIPTISTNECL